MKMQQIKKLFQAIDMTVGEPWKKIITFTVPMLLGNIAQQMYNTVDSIVVGNYVGDNALAAVGRAHCESSPCAFYWNQYGRQYYGVTVFWREAEKRPLLYNRELHCADCGCRRIYYGAGGRYSAPASRIVENAGKYY